jgi:hypothetical protein
MNEYNLKEIIVGLRRDYQELQFLLTKMKQSLRIDDELLVNMSEVKARIENKHHIEFYVPSKRRKQWQLLGGYSTGPTVHRNYVWPTCDVGIKVLNDTTGVVIDPGKEQDFFESAEHILNSDLVLGTPIKATMYEDTKKEFFITPEVVHYANFHNGFMDLSVDYLPDGDEIKVVTDFDEAHSVLLNSALESSMAATLFTEDLREKIEGVKDVDLKAVTEGSYYHTSKYGFIKDDKGYALKRTYGESHF